MWIESRGLDAGLAVRYGVTGAVVPGGGDWLAIPYLRHGRVDHHKFRRIDAKDFRQERGAHQFLWNEDCLRDKTLASQPLVATEGEMDALAAIQSGFVRTVSVPGGAGGKAVGYLDEAWAELQGVERIVLATDGDEPGVGLMNELALRLGKGRCHYVVYPEGIKDLNELLLAHGEGAVAAAITGAAPVRVSGLYRMHELPPVPEPEACISGFPGLDDHYRLRKGDFCVVVGIPGHGKTTLVNDLACHMVETHDWRVCFASFEQPPQWDHKRALVRWKTGRDERELSYHDLIDVHAWLGDRFSFVVPDDEDDPSLEWLIERMATAVRRHGADMCVIDPWNELEHQPPERNMTETQYTNWAIRQLKRFARRFSVHVIVVVHPNKLQRQQDGSLPVPTLYDASGSAAWLNKPDVGLIVHRQGTQTLVRVAKSRYHDRIGTPGTVELRFRTEAGRYALWGIDAQG